MDRINAFNTLIDNARKVGIVSHSHPDGDALGSCTAMWHYLTSRGKQAVILLESRWPEAVDFILDGDIRTCISLYEDSPSAVQQEAKECDLFVFTDLNGVSRTGLMQPVFDGLTAPRVLIDHHLAPHTEEFAVVFSTALISSACELVLQVTRQMPDIQDDLTRLPLAFLTAIMTGITTDTNNFANSTFPSTLRAVSDMLQAGVDREMVVSHIYNEYKERRIRLMGKLLTEMKITSDGVAYMLLDQATTERFAIESGETEGFVNIPLGIKEVRMSIFAREENGQYRISVRSKKGTSANRIALSHFNGGGHEQAAGGRLQQGPGLETTADLEAYILKVTQSFFENEQ